MFQDSKPDKPRSVRHSVKTVGGKPIIAAFLSVCVMAAGLATVLAPASAQSTQQTDWTYYDNPELFPEGGNWLAGDPVSADRGYGDAKYHNGVHWSNYAYVSTDGNRDPSGHYAVWTTDKSNGRYEIEVYVPKNHATARVRYVISTQSSDIRPEFVDQAAIGGWYSIGSYYADNEKFTVSTYYDESQDTRIPGVLNGANPRSVGVDAIRMRCVADCSESTGSQRPTAPTNVQFRVSGDDVVASWSPPSSDGGSAITGYTVTITRPGRTFGPYDLTAGQRRFTITGAWSNTKYTVQVVAKNRNGVSQIARASVTTPTSGQAPTVPTNVQFRVSGDDVVASWSPPSSDGGSAITGYTVTITRPERTFGPYDRKASARTHTIRNALSNTTYTVRVAAKNRIGVSQTVRASVTTPASGSSDRPPGQVGPVSLEWHKAFSPWDRHDDVTVSWPRVSGASNYEVAYWFARSNGISEEIEEAGWATISKFNMIGLECCDNDKLPTTDETSTNSYKLYRIFDDRIPGKLMVTVRALNDHGEGRWSDGAPPRRLEDESNGRGVHFETCAGGEIDLSRWEWVIRAGVYLKLVPNWTNLAATVGKSAFNIARGCSSLLDEVLMSLRLNGLVEFLKQAQCKASTLDITAQRLAGTDSSLRPYIQCGVLYE